MNNKSYIFIGNWKMYYSHNNVVSWLHNHNESLKTIAATTPNNVVICPSFESIYLFEKTFDNTAIAWGAQDCSPFDAGAQTAQISAPSLAQLGCTYCIIGHSEQRRYASESSSLLTQKIYSLIENDIIPILCIGETREEYINNQTRTILETQLAILANIPDCHILIAYEPVWAIGTGKIPHLNVLETIFNMINQQIQVYPCGKKAQFLYGGSVSSSTVVNLKSIPTINGFLIGKASTDFQELKKIVSLV